MVRVDWTGRETGSDKFSCEIWGIWTSSFPSGASGENPLCCPLDSDLWMMTTEDICVVLWSSIYIS